MAGIAFFMLSVFYALIDVFDIYSGTPFLYFGRNSITIYICHTIFASNFPFFNVKKVFDNLESKYGEKLMIESETRNFISYMLLSIQYDITDLSFRIVKYANKRTMNNNVLIAVIGHIMPDDIITKLKLKLDSSSIETNVVEEEEEEDEEEPDEESEEV